jgi:hydroxylamine reductase (hybrid-cluster protein)
VFNSKKLNGDTHTSTKREREREEEREKQREREKKRERSRERERDFIKLQVVEKEREKMSKSGMSSAAKRIQKELAEISLEPPTNCSAGPKGDNLYEWVSTIMGPPGTNSSSHSSSFFVFFSLSFRERVHTTTKFKKKS